MGGGYQREQREGNCRETDQMWKRIDPAMHQIKRLNDESGEKADQKHRVVTDEDQRRLKQYENLRDS